MLPSSIAYSKPASSAKALNIRWKASAITHRRNRLNTEFHLSKSSGRSREGTTRPGDPEDSLDENPGVRAGATGVTFPARIAGRNLRPDRRGRRRILVQG